MNRRDFMKLSGLTLACAAQTTAFSTASHTPVAPDLSKAIAFVDGEVAAGTVPGAALAVSLRGETLLAKYAGTWCSTELRDNPYGPGPLNFAFSFSKVVSATVVAMAKEDGMISYDEPVRAYVPEFKGGGKDVITLRHLLTHSAGLPSVPMGAVHTEDKWNEAVKAMCAADVEWEPGSKTAYHGLTGLFMAGEVVRSVSGRMPWPQICQERLFTPLGLESFTFIAPPEGDNVSLTPRPKETPCPFNPETYLLGHPAGGMLFRPADALRFLNMHLNGGTMDGKRIMKDETVLEMREVQYYRQIQEAVAAGKTPVHEFWGLGWLERGTTTEGWFGFGDVISEQSFGHAGINTVIGVADPETKLALSFLTTDSPPDDKATIRLRNTVTNLVAEAVKGC